MHTLTVAWTMVLPLYIRSFASCYIFSVLFYVLFLFISHFRYPDILCYSNYCFSCAMSYFPMVAIVPAAQALTVVFVRLKLMLQAIYLTCIKLMSCNDTRTLYFMHHETRTLSYCCDLALLLEFWPMGAQLPLKAALPLAERIATASDRCSGTGSGSKLSPLLRSLWGTFQHLISLLTHFVSMGVLAVVRMLRRMSMRVLQLDWMHDTHAMFIVICFAVVIMTNDRISSGWLIWHWGNHDCPSGNVGQTRWNLSGVDQFQATARDSGVPLTCVTYNVNYVLCLYIPFMTVFVLIMICIFSGIKCFESWILIAIQNKAYFALSSTSWRPRDAYAVSKLGHYRFL